MSKFMTETRYKPLKTGDLIKEGDEFELKNGDWWETYSAGYCVGDPPTAQSSTYRRPIVTKYRVLGPEETLRKGDEHKASRLTCWGPVPSWWVGWPGRDYPEYTFRRRLHKKAGVVAPSSKPIEKTVPEIKKAAPVVQPEPPKPDLGADGVGVGYRKLKVGEKVQEGDEFNFDGYWRKTSKPGFAVNNLVYRRKIEQEVKSVDVGVGYRKLERGEKILCGDELQVLDGTWELSNAIGYRLYEDTHTWEPHPYRRKIEPPPSTSYSKPPFIKELEALIEKYYGKAPNV
jgi:hypothetical protein